TTPTSVHRAFRVSGLVVVSVSAMAAEPSCLFTRVLRLLRRGELPLPLERLEPRDVPAGLADLAGRLQPVGRRPEAQLEGLLLHVLERAGQLVGRQVPVLGGLLLTHGHTRHFAAARRTNRHLNGILYATRA